MCLRDLSYSKNLPEFVDWKKKHAAVDNSTKSSFQKKALNKSAKLPLSICLKSAQPNSQETGDGHSLTHSLCKPAVPL